MTSVTALCAQGGYPIVVQEHGYDLIVDDIAFRTIAIVAARRTDELESLLDDVQQTGDVKILEDLRVALPASCIVTRPTLNRARSLPLDGIDCGIGYQLSVRPSISNENFILYCDLQEKSEYSDDEEFEPLPWNFWRQALEVSLDDNPRVIYSNGCDPWLEDIYGKIEDAMIQCARKNMDLLRILARASPFISEVEYVGMQCYPPRLRR